jgi:hypothetical protein
MTIDNRPWQAVGPAEANAPEPTARPPARQGVEDVGRYLFFLDKSSTPLHEGPHSEIAAGGIAFAGADHRRLSPASVPKNYVTGELRSLKSCSSSAPERAGSLATRSDLKRIENDLPCAFR